MGEDPEVHRVVIVDDQSLLVGAFDLLISSQSDMRTAGTAADGAAALDLLRTERAAGRRVDVVLLDLRMPVMDGIEAIRRMRSDPQLHDQPVLVLTTFDDEQLVLAALRAGADGFLLKDADPPVLLQALRSVAAGGSWLDPAVTRTVLAHLGAVREPVGAPGQALSPGPDTARGVPLMAREPLTRREQEVLELVCRGLSNLGIGQQLHLAESTVKTHVKSLLAKTGTANRVELIVFAFDHGLTRRDR